jgi:hypothetical protein
MLSKQLSIFSILWTLLLTSCASSFDQPAIDWQNGAKRGWIVSFYTPDSASVDLPNCLANLPKADLATRHFVKVEYRHVRQMYSEVAELPAAMQAKINDQVELWPEDCSRGKISRIARVLPPLSQ